MKLSIIHEDKTFGVTSKPIFATRVFRKINTENEEIELGVANFDHYFAIDDQNNTYTTMSIYDGKTSIYYNPKLVTFLLPPTPEPEKPEELDNPLDDMNDVFRSDFWGKLKTKYENLPQKEWPIQITPAQ